MIGKRVVDNTEPHLLHAGEYTKITEPIHTWWPGKVWWVACSPNGIPGNLINHEVIEHEDGTISVKPSILINADRPNKWHGYLEHGIWREC